MDLKSRSILLISRDPALAGILQEIFYQQGMNVQAAKSEEEDQRLRQAKEMDAWIWDRSSGNSVPFSGMLSPSSTDKSQSSGLATPKKTVIFGFFPFIKDFPISKLFHIPSVFPQQFLQILAL